MAISGNQWQSVAISGSQWQSRAWTKSRTRRLSSLEIVRESCSLTHSFATKIVRHTETGVLPPPVWGGGAPG